MSQNEEKDSKTDEKPKEGKNKPQTSKGQPAELLYMGSNPIPGSMDNCQFFGFIE